MSTTQGFEALTRFPMSCDEISSCWVTVVSRARGSYWGYETPAVV